MFFAPLQVHVRVIRFHRLLSCPRLCCFFLPESELILRSGVFFFPFFKEILSGVIGRFRCLGSVCFPWVAPQLHLGEGERSQALVGCVYNGLSTAEAPPSSFRKVFQPPTARPPPRPWLHSRSCH